MARRPKPSPLGQAVPQVAEVCLGRRGRRVHDLGAQRRRAVLRVGVRLGAPQPVVDVDGPDAIPEGAQHVPEARRVGAARDEARHLAPEGIRSWVRMCRSTRSSTSTPEVCTSRVSCSRRGHAQGRTDNACDSPQALSSGLAVGRRSEVDEPRRRRPHGVSAACSTAAAVRANGVACGTCSIRAAGNRPSDASSTYRIGSEWETATTTSSGRDRACRGLRRSARPPRRGSRRPRGLPHRARSSTPSRGSRRAGRPRTPKPISSRAGSTIRSASRPPRELERLLRPREPRGDAEADALVGERLAQRQGLDPPAPRGPPLAPS